MIVGKFLRKKIVAIFLFNLLVMPVKLNHASNNQIYSIEGNGEKTIEISAEKYSLINIEIQVDEIVKYNFELISSIDEIIDSGYNQTGNFFSAHLALGQFTVVITNLRKETLELSVLKEIIPLEQNFDIAGYNYKNKIFCWKFDTSSSGFQIQFPITSIKQNYYYLTFIAQNSLVFANVWFAFSNPQTDSGWDDHLDPYSFNGNSRKTVDIEEEVKWLYIEITPEENYELILILRTSSDFSLIGKVLVGLAAAFVGVCVFILYYFDPLKYRKRKVKGNDYKGIKKDYEHPKDLGFTIREVLAKVEKEK